MRRSHTLSQKESISLISRYLDEVKTLYQSGQATEHSYRPALCTLLSGLFQGYTVINEEKRRSCGAPDLTINKSGAPVFFFEAKDIGESYLRGSDNRNQFSRYTSALEAVVFTDYLSFHFYCGEELAKEVTIATVSYQKIKPVEDQFAAFLELIDLLKSLEPRAITSSGQLARAMAAKARLLRDATYRYLQKNQQESSNSRFSDTSLLTLYKNFCDTLNPDLALDDFSDIYAQTLTYGLFTARLHDSTPNNFSREEAMRLIPKSNPFLRQLFNHVSADLEEEIAWIVDDLIALFAVSNVAGIMRAYNQDHARKDPMIHFYEDFLSTYDAGTRKDRGVWYTPLPIVRFMVKAIDQILEEDFGLTDGIADSARSDIKILEPQTGGSVFEKAINIPRLQILDPATGTGTFLAECVRQIYSKFEGNEGTWASYVKDDLIPRLNGFEILMAPYAMAHLKLDLVLKDTGYIHDNRQRFNIFLTDSLKNDSNFPEGGFYVMALREEAVAAENVKENYPVMVVIGNPPYKGESENRNRFIMDLIQDYKKEPGTNERLGETNPKGLNNDYVKFIRLAENYIEKNGSGIVAFINPHGFLTSAVFRGMRYHLLQTFNEIYVLDLHGDTREKECASDGGKDENVFNILQGVSINIFVKKPNDNSGCHLYHASQFGKRAEKFSFLALNDFKNVKYQEFKVTPPNYFFVPKTYENQQSYDEYFSIKDLFMNMNSGVKTHNDSELVSFDKFNLPTNYEYNYRPFDFRNINYDLEKVVRPRFDVMKHFICGDNLGLVVGRQGKVIGDDEWNIVFVTNKITDINIFYRGGCSIFPLYLYQKDPIGFFSKESNFNNEKRKQILERLDFVPTPENIFDYIYAVLHTPEYREKYKEFLNTDFPRIPYPENSKMFKCLADIGEELRLAHLLQDDLPSLRRGIGSFPISGNNDVSSIRYDNQKVFINETQYFDRIPEDIFSMSIGGYQVAYKYLKDRKGRALSGEELKHYRRIILALIKTRTLMEKLSRLSSKWL